MMLSTDNFLAYRLSIVSLALWVLLFVSMAPISLELYDVAEQISLIGVDQVAELIKMASTLVTLILVLSAVFGCALPLRGKGSFISLLFEALLFNLYVCFFVAGVLVHVAAYFWGFWFDLGWHTAGSFCVTLYFVGVAAYSQAKKSYAVKTD